MSEVVYSPEMIPSRQRPFWSALWDDDLRSFCLHFLGDVTKFVLILSSLELFWELVQLLRFRGYPEDLLRKLEYLHFAFVYASLAVLGVIFVGKVIGVGRKKQ